MDKASGLAGFVIGGKINKKERLCDMATESLNIFLSASVPVAGRADGEYLATADIIAIRDAVIALASVVLPKYHLIWGGHPSITPLITNVLKHSNKEVNASVTVYQSGFFSNVFPEENRNVEHIVITENLGDRNRSLELMRKQMIEDNQYGAAVFIGGMDGVEKEFDLFRKMHPGVPCLPIASTGAAAKILYNRYSGEFNERLLTELSYASLFKDMLGL